MLSRLIRIFTKQEASEIIVIVNPQMPDVAGYAHWLKDAGRATCPCTLTVLEKTTPSSMHSFWHLSQVIPKGKFCLTTVDTIFREDDFKGYIDAFDRNTDHDGMWAVTPFVDDEKPLWVDVDQQMNITAFRDKRWIGAKFVSGGIYAMTDHAFTVLDNCIEQGISRMRNFQRALVENGHKLKAYSIDKIVDVDHAGDIATAEAFLNS